MDKTWTPIAVYPEGIQVTWKEKYGPERTESCIGLWQDEKGNYMLTWKDEKKIIIQYSNVTEIGYSTIK